VDLGEPLVLVVSLGIVLLIIFLDAYAFKIFSEHMTVLEVVVCGPFMVGTWLFKHFVENAPAGGASRFLVISSSNKVIGRGLELALLVLLLLLPVVPL
jgi:flagellar biogenesis protein FliO